MARLDKAAPDTLSLDLSNPRMPDTEFAGEDEAIAYLYAQADLGELIQSIGNSGWLDFEPLIVEEKSRTVIEGNRRLAALRIIASPRLQQQFKVALPHPLHENAVPSEIQVNYVESRKEARDFIGFKHVNGAFKWDSYAKARFAHSWLQDGDDIQEVSRRLGDGHNTVSRLVNGVVVLEQAEESKLFDRELRSKKSFYFSHLYTALSTANVRQFLGLPESDNSVLPANPVPASHRTQLRNFLSWLYGQEDEPALIRSQNPDLGRLVNVLGSERAVRALESNRDLDRAFDVVEDKAKAFEKAFYHLVSSAEDVSRIIARYDPKSDLVDDAETTLRVVTIVVNAMKEAHLRGNSTNES
ncbi:hypothetical protein SAMN02745244_02607 [Tessaracoccus bendigoensis DSM 12906]|uniref:ParB-like nuclease domain-containing protein n=1 Tax=Tessaracoccus bendigoensis DSM 12906 TaxID=1123357 RepID=A0A1M6JP44_9ACTN|nr:hypothetical protein [Tessaracoccus bendigoensis]SHJ48353.1 hypothetical protein SAMN02745244_02607 [Tessaracoccus bendigoensis DSM 12906]